MIVDGSLPPLALKRRRLTTMNSMEAEVAKAKLAAVKEKFGRDLRVFDTSVHSSSPTQQLADEEPDDFYEFTAEDYFRIMATRKEDKYLKTRKIREAEEASRRERIKKTAVRVRFPDNHTLEATFHPSEKLHSLFDLISNVVTRPDLPFYLYTTPPKKHVKDLSQDFYSAGFIPGAIVYFSYDLPQGDDAIAVNSGPFLQEEIMSLKGLDVVSEAAEPILPAPEPPTAFQVAVLQDQPKRAEKKPVKPKWLKM